MNLYDNTLYMEDVRRTAQLDLPWDSFTDRAVLISGATGLVGSFLIDVLMERNERFSMNCRVYALGRSEEKARARFGASPTNFVVTMTALRPSSLSCSALSRIEFRPKYTHVCVLYLKGSISFS